MKGWSQDGLNKSAVPLRTTFVSLIVTSDLAFQPSKMVPYWVNLKKTHITYQDINEILTLLNLLLKPLKLYDKILFSILFFQITFSSGSILTIESIKRVIQFQMLYFIGLNMPIWYIFHIFFYIFTYIYCIYYITSFYLCIYFCNKSHLFK